MTSKGAHKMGRDVSHGGTFVAKFKGKCRTCGQMWEPDDYISAQPGGGYGHVKCPGQQPQALYRVMPLE